MGSAGNSCGGRYPLGQCTAGGAAIFPGVCSSPNLGNGGDWYGVAAGLGWPHQQGQAVPGWLASFNVDPPYGDVGLVEAVQGQQLLRNGVNWHLDGNWSRDWVAVDLVRGSFLPPGQFVAPPGYQGPTPATSQVQTMAASGGQGAGPAATGARGLRCQFAWQIPSIQLIPSSPNLNPLPFGPQIQTPAWSVGGQSVCLDGLIGIAAWTLGAIGFLVVAWLLVRGPVERAAGRTAQAAGAGAEVAGTVTLQPEVVEAGAAATAAGGAVHEEGVRHTPHPIQRARALAGPAQPPQPESVQVPDEGPPPGPPAQGEGQRALPAPRQAPRRRGRSAITGLSVQEQQTFRELTRMGYSPVNARRGAQAAGSQGDKEQRVLRAIRAIR